MYRTLKKDLKSLFEIDELKIGRISDKPLFCHKEHRFTLAIIYYAQLMGEIQKPCNLILFDRHHDMTPVDNKFTCDENEDKYDEINRFIDYCTNMLKISDDDWITAGFEAGIIKDVVAIGVDVDRNAYRNHIYTDKNEIEHKVYINLSFPSSELHSRGALGDLAMRERHDELHEIMNWGLIEERGKGFDFINNDNDLILSIDLDCFSRDLNESITYPLPSIVFEKIFIEKFDYSHTSINSGIEFMDKLVNQCKLVTIAREPDYCGGEKGSDDIFGKVNKFMFDSQIRLES